MSNPSSPPNKGKLQEEKQTKLNNHEGKGEISILEQLGCCMHFIQGSKKVVRPRVLPLEIEIAFKFFFKRKFKDGGRLPIKVLWSY